MPLFLRRSLAVTLPVCLLYVFLACLAVCSLHAEDESFAESESSFTSSSLVATESEDCCSVSDGERSVIPQRISFASLSTSVIRALFIHSISHAPPLQSRDRYSLAGPDLSLLGNLRI